MASSYIYAIPKYCVYLTIYSGNKLPMFYIGSTHISKINSGYHGSVSSRKYKAIWNSESKTNEHLFKTLVLKETYSRKYAYFIEKQLQTKLGIPKNPMYVNLSIAMTNWIDILNKSSRMTGKKHSENTKQKMRYYANNRSTDHIQRLREAGKNRIMSEEHNKKNSEAKRGKPMRKLQCPYCGQIGGNGNMQRWHFDNCKKKPNS